MRLIGMAELALELMCKRALTRTAFGKPLAKLGGNMDVIANARIKIDQARMLVLKAAWMIDQVGAEGAMSEISQIKVVAPNVAQSGGRRHSNARRRGTNQRLSFGGLIYGRPRPALSRRP